MFKPAIRFFGAMGTKYFSGYTGSIKEELKKSNISILYEMYIGKMFFASFMAFVLSFIFITISLPFFGIDIFMSIISGFIVSVTAAIALLTIFHSYPYQILVSKKNSIDANMPFAINHMAAIASSGVPPFVIFKLLANVSDYREISNECSRIVRNTEVFGMDIITAVKNVADRTPSPDFKQFLYGIISNIETGGDLAKFFQMSAKDAMIDYRLKREKYLQTLSTYADFYTAVLIAAPLFFISILSIMSMLGGQIFGLSIPNALRIGIYVLMPMMNIIFILFIHYTQPSV